ncbi:MAG TPA: hypothetical protein VIS54_03140, partial [Psychromonas sp.]
SNQATFLSCSKCLTVLCVAFISETVCIGAVNATLLTEKKVLKTPISISPKQLAASEKIKRWAALWAPLKIT